MKNGRSIITLSAMILLAGFTLPVTAQSASSDAMTLLKTAEHSLFPANYEASMTMETVHPGKETKTMSFTILAREGTGSLMEITDPVRSKGIRFLQVDGNLLMYSPRSGSRRAVRLSAQDSFQGSLFANSDVSDSTYSDDYTPVNKGTVTLDHPVLGSVSCIMIEGTASHAKSPYSRIEMWILADSLIPVKFNFYAKSGLLFRTMTLSDLKPLAGQMRPTLMRMEAATDPGAWTDVRINSLALRNDLSPAQFTESSLTR